MDYLNQEKFEEKPKSLVFNGGKAGVVNGCKIVIKRKGDDDADNAPKYSILALDPEQQANNDENITVYPVNKGFFVKNEFDKFKSKEDNKEAGNFPSAAAEKFAVNELKHLLKVTGHEFDDKNQPVISEKFNGFEGFMDYVFTFVNNSLNKDKTQMFNIAVDYGNGAFASNYLRLNGYPWYVMKIGEEIENARDAIMDRPQKDSEETQNNSSFGENSDDENSWTESEDAKF